MVDSAEIKIWGELIGAVLWDKTRRLASFQFDKKFLTKKWDLSPIKMPLSNGNRIYSFPELLPSKDSTENTFQGLPGMLADSLPDKYGNQLIDKWLAQNGRPPNSMNPVEKLCFIGTRGMGALEFEVAILKKSNGTFAIEISSLVDMAQMMLENRENFEIDLSADKEKAMREILKIGTSAGGARPKAVITFNKKTKEIRSGQTSAPVGFEHWLIKLDGVSGVQFGETHGFGRVEYAYYLMARDCGINMMECDLLVENSRAHFMTKRFDREGSNIKHHVQTLCGIQHFDYNNIYGYSYEQLFQTMRMLKLSYPDAEQMFRRMVFNVISTNYDDHAKNFSFLLKQDSKWELSPAYDICYSYDPTNVWVNQHTLSINGKHKNITKADLLSIAKSNSISIGKGEKIIKEIKSVIGNWETYAEKVNVCKKLKDSISKTLFALK